mmetsp:Transcript_4232/g.5200  ORF Transcript_4232/g.5200 Transcript_4232/m.5200 type:complete len:390 (-) Transcript_4232:168-1337(-)|eukprot:CAMPEP_0184016402 /NCGR_PEP_ID=MMETSP0954-20121128/6910_1 /TAXON_ID=627963 /ORGANISM="Aplanochytrium sp, Strain PBS07" /LENGTH=389 /DNA_ID=CAMNT_0026297421 /DNA_START=769 /DNA_END=1938 /DNA_ORIENTATION=-
MDFTEFNASNTLFNGNLQERQPKYGSLSSGDSDENDCAVFRSVSALAQPQGLSPFGFNSFSADETYNQGILKNEKLTFKSENGYSLNTEKSILTSKSVELPSRLCISALPLCHMYVNLARDSLFETIELELKKYQKNIDFNFSSETQSWDITLYSDTLEETAVSLCMYSTPSSNILLEFRKLSGCAFTSCALFKHIKNVLVEKNVVRDVNGDTLSLDTKKPVFGLGSICESKTESELLLESSLSENRLQRDYFDDDVDESDSDFDELFDMYFHLAVSKCLDTQMEGYRLIASELVGADKSTVNKFINCDIPEYGSAISFLTKSCTSNINGVCRYAVTALAEISSHSEFHSQLKEANTIKIVSSIYGYQKIVPEIKRQAKVVLTNLLGVK